MNIEDFDDHEQNMYVRITDLETKIEAIVKSVYLLIEGMEHLQSAVDILISRVR